MIDIFKDLGIGASGGKALKSMQKITHSWGTYGTSVYKDIQKVDINKSIIIQEYYHNVEYPAYYGTAISFYNDSQLEFLRYRDGSGGTPLYAKVYEFENVKSKQSGFYNYNNPAGLISIGINKVDPTKCLIAVNSTGDSTSTYGLRYQNFKPFREITNNGTTLNIYATDSTKKIYWQILEFK